MTTRNYRLFNNPRRLDSKHNKLYFKFEMFNIDLNFNWNIGHHFFDYKWFCLVRFDFKISLHWIHISPYRKNATKFVFIWICSQDSENILFSKMNSISKENLLLFGVRRIDSVKFFALIKLKIIWANMKNHAILTVQPLLLISIRTQ